MGKVFTVTYVRRPTGSDRHWLTVVTAMQAGLIAVLCVVCRSITGRWWHPFLWWALVGGVIGIVWGLRDRALARRRCDRQDPA
ncbi:hypothetical protein [Nakamurella deserti]|uniref:hypothetical protein n=1 Tax=Nakamurella deserti TaxID=2164074 RepID=UPI000DBE9B6E|nr:hypothetical protein [Nakamurella deserti]